MSLERTGEKLTKKGEKLKIVLNDNAVKASKTWRFVDTGAKDPNGHNEYRIQNCATGEYLSWDTRGLFNKTNNHNKMTDVGEGKEKKEIIHGLKTTKNKKKIRPYRHIFTLNKTAVNTNSKKSDRFFDTWILRPQKNEGYQIIDSHSGLYQLFSSEIKAKNEKVMLIWAGSNRIWSKKSNDLKRLWTFEKLTNVIHLNNQYSF